MRESPVKARPVRILHVEDNRLVSEAIRDTLTDMGWAVMSCPDGAEAMEVLAGNKPFDLIIFDYDLPGRNGLELLRHARTLPHRRRVPTVMFSASDVETEAWRAGADAFLRKPEDIDSLAATVTRLLTKGTD